MEICGFCVFLVVTDGGLWLFVAGCLRIRLPTVLFGIWLGSCLLIWCLVFSLAWVCFVYFGWVCFVWLVLVGFFYLVGVADLCWGSGEFAGWVLCVFVIYVVLGCLIWLYDDSDWVIVVCLFVICLPIVCCMYILLFCAWGIVCRWCFGYNVVCFTIVVLRFCVMFCFDVWCLLLCCAVCGWLCGLFDVVVLNLVVLLF